MRILVYGAGVLGCNLANNFFRAGKDVTLLARGNGLRKSKITDFESKNQKQIQARHYREPRADGDGA